MLQSLLIEGCFLVNNFFAEDIRGSFIKTFHYDNFLLNGLQTSFKESYYSTSYKDVIRGMHFQTPPHEHEKLVYVTNGKILDVILDLRVKSSTYLQYITVELVEKSSSIYIPKGCAHGFLTLSEEATVVYNVSTVYNPEFDAGVRWDSFGFDWLDVGLPIISPRDRSFDKVSEFNSPF